MFVKTLAAKAALFAISVFAAGLPAAHAETGAVGQILGPAHGDAAPGLALGEHAEGEAGTLDLDLASAVAAAVADSTGDGPAQTETRPVHHDRGGEESRGPWPDSGTVDSGDQAEGGAGFREDDPPGLDRRLLHGFRLGYSFITNADQPDPHNRDESVKESLGLASPHLFVLGYEAFYRMVGHDWLNVILVGNVMVAGLEQSTVIPTANGLLGFELDESFQVGVGVNLAPDEDKPTHMVAAAGWTPQVGSFYVPVHFHLIPDIDQNHRFGTTIGINW